MVEIYQITVFLSDSDQFCFCPHWFSVCPIHFVIICVESVRITGICCSVLSVISKLKWLSQKLQRINSCSLCRSTQVNLHFLLVCISCAISIVVGIFDVMYQSSWLDLPTLWMRYCVSHGLNTMQFRDIQIGPNLGIQSLTCDD